MTTLTRRPRGRSDDRSRGSAAGGSGGARGSAVPRRTRRARARSWGQRNGSDLLLLAPGVVLLGVLALYPIYILGRMALSQVSAGNLLGYWPASGLDNFVTVLRDPTFAQVLVQTLTLVLAVLVFTLTLGFLVAMLLRRATRLTTMTQTVMLLVWALPPVVVGSLSKFMLDSGGPINGVLVATGLLAAPEPFLSQPRTSLLGIAAVTIWVGVPFAALVIKSAILDVPVEIWEAARLDGANVVQTVWSIVLPSIKPTLYIVAVLNVVGTFKAFDLIYVMTRGGPGVSSSTIPFWGYLTAFQDYEFGAAAAISVFAMLMVLALAAAYIAALRREER